MSNMVDDSAHFKSELEGYIGRNAHSRAFRLGAEEMKVLGWQSGSTLSIGFSKYKVVEAEKGVWYLFKMPGGKSPKNYSISGDVFVVGKKTLSIVDLVGWRPESSEPDSETIAVKGGATSAPPPNTVPPPPPPTPLPNDGELEVPNA